MREIINLNFNWLFACNFEDEHLRTIPMLQDFKRSTYLIILLIYHSIILMKKKLKRL